METHKSLPQIRCSGKLRGIQTIVPVGFFGLIPNLFLYFQFHSNKVLQVVALRVSELRLIFSMTIDGRKDTQSVKLARSALHSELESAS